MCSLGCGHLDVVGLLSPLGGRMGRLRTTGVGMIAARISTAAEAGPFHRTLLVDDEPLVARPLGAISPPR